MRCSQMTQMLLLYLISLTNSIPTVLTMSLSLIKSRLPIFLNSQASVGSVDH